MHKKNQHLMGTLKARYKHGQQQWQQKKSESTTKTHTGIVGDKSSTYL